MPDFVTEEMVEEARGHAVVNKKGLEPLRQISYEKLTEGITVQMMHVGPYAAEPETIECIQDYMKKHGLVQNGRYHEVYLSDPRKVKPEEMKTILRFPVKRRII